MASIEIESDQTTASGGRDIEDTGVEIAPRPLRGSEQPRMFTHEQELSKSNVSRKQAYAR